jgi:DNA helicase HerA-like ATPase
MPDDFEIGRVIAVDTAQVTIELNKDLKALTRTTYEGALEVGRINSYVILPIGARRLVAMVTRVVLAEEAEIRADRTMVALPSARRTMKATLIGTLDGRAFTQGVSVFPVLDNPVHLAAAGDLDLIFDRADQTHRTVPDPKRPGFCVGIGQSAVFSGYPIQIDPDALFGKHAAVLGSTGSGKSCTIASLIQSILGRAEIRRTHFVILDTNGEYRSAFQRRAADGTWADVGERKTLYIPSDPRESAQRVTIPYWFLNSDDFVRLFRAREGLQAPVLLRALRLSRAKASGEAGVSPVLEVLRTACTQILALSQNDAPTQQWAIPGNIGQRCTDGLRYREEFPNHVSLLDSTHGGDLFQNWEHALRQVQTVTDQASQQGNQGGLGGTRIQQIRDAIDPVIQSLNRIIAERPLGTPGVSADQPLYFERSQFLESALDTAMREQAESGSPGRIRDACGPMFLRIRRFFEDPRFRFLFDQHPDAAHVLATFLRDVLGLPSVEEPTPPLSEENAVRSGALPFYDRQRADSQGHQIVILDLSLLAAEVLENVTALIGRLILEFLQRLGEFGNEDSRGSLPVVLVLEEAQNYIGQPRQGEEESISRVVFERIAREGRKYGLGLVVASQRPSELSRTVLSQCSSFIVHRLQNPEDLRYFKDIVPGIYGPLLDQLPALAPQTALVLGECVRAPALVRIREAQPLPRSRDPRFYQYWVKDTDPAVDVESICARWEGKSGDETPAGANDEVETG